jgi:hypothetical protein
MQTKMLIAFRVRLAPAARHFYTYTNPILSFWDAAFAVDLADRMAAVDSLAALQLLDNDTLRTLDIHLASLPVVFLSTKASSQLELSGMTLWNACVPLMRLLLSVGQGDKGRLNIFCRGLQRFKLGA